MKEPIHFSRKRTSAATTMFFAAIAIASTGAIAGDARAEAPTFTALLPAGGQQGTEVVAAVTGKVDPWPVKIHSDSEFLTITAEEEKGKIKVAVADDAPPTIHWFRLYNDEGATQPIPFVVGTVPEVAEKSGSIASLDSAQAIESLPVTINGVLSRRGEVDNFAFDMKEGQLLVASLRANTTIGSPMDAVLQIVNEQGFVVAQNDDYHGFDPHLVYEAPQDGKYYVRTFAFPATPNSTINFSGGNNYVYRLTLTTGAFVSHAHPLSAFRAEPEPVRLFGWNLPDGAQLPIAGPEIGGKVWLTSEGSASSIAVDLVDHPVAAEREEPSDSIQALTPPVALTGRLSVPGEVDVYSLTAKEKQTFQISIESRSLFFPLDPVLVITDKDGKVLQEMDDVNRETRDVELTYESPLEGELRLQIKDLHRRGGDRYVYRLSVTPVVPDFAVTLAADKFTLKPGETLDIPVTIARRNNFSGDVEVKVEGLPEGVNVEIDEPEEKEESDRPRRGRRGRGRGRGNSDTVTLKLTAPEIAGAVSAAIKIVGESNGDDKLVRVATAPIPENTAVTKSPWLTVLAPPKEEEKKDEEKKDEKKE